MSERNFFTPEQVKPLYGQIVPAYQKAFEGKPWFEVSKCADIRKRCEGGLSPMKIGATCITCCNRLLRPAYEDQELIERFDMQGSTRPTSWYLEQVDNEQGEESVALAAIAWSATTDTIASEKYPDVPMMQEWLDKTIGQRQITWIDEVFANPALRPVGNLRRFGEMAVGFAARLGSPLVAYRTISPQMIKAPVRDFGSLASVKDRKADVPDRRDFVVINLEAGGLL